MSLTEERLAGLMVYCRLVELAPGERELLETLCDSAEQYMEEAGVPRPAEGTGRRAQYDLCVNYLVLESYDRRDPVITGTIVSDNPAFRRLLTQLKLTQAAYDTGGEE